MKTFYTEKLGLEFVSEEKDRHIFLKAGKSMLLVFNPNNTLTMGKSVFPIHGVNTPPSIIHLAFEIDKEDYNNWKERLDKNEIIIEKEIEFDKGIRSIYFRDPVGNLIELITKDAWPIDK